MAQFTLVGLFNPLYHSMLYPTKFDENWDTCSYTLKYCTIIRYIFVWLNQKFTYVQTFYGVTIARLKSYSPWIYF